MKKKIKLTIIVMGILIGILLILFLIFSNSINIIFTGVPDKNCNYDSDCALKKTTCEPCDCGDAVNKMWNRFCPLPIYVGRIYCKMCASLGYDFDIKCVNNQCQKIWKNR